MKVHTVSQIVGEIKTILEGEFADLSVEGEITNLSKSSAGHYYFNISDKNSAMSCALFKMDSLRNPIIRKLKDGDKVILRGPISVYQKRGSFQLIVKRITPVGKGDLKAQFEALKADFAKKGYFDLSHKKSIPVLPKRIGVITALGAAALQDFLNIMQRRSLWYDIVIIPATVQGDNCAKEVMKAIDKAVKKEDLDVLVITRGGGSLEDLWGFNDKDLVQKIFDCPLPVISAIGHQVDFTLCDYVSDHRCETPSAAAEMLSQPHTQIQRKVSNMGKFLKGAILEIKSELERRIYKVNPLNAIQSLKSKQNQYNLAVNKLNPLNIHDPIHLNENYQLIDEFQTQLMSSMQEKLQKSTQRLENSNLLLNSLSPKNVLNRGYTIISSDQGEVLTSYKQFARIKEETELSIQFSDGIGKAKK